MKKLHIENHFVTDENVNVPWYDHKISQLPTLFILIINFTQQRFGTAYKCLAETNFYMVESIVFWIL